MSKYERPATFKLVRSDGQIVTIVGDIEWEPAGITPPNARLQNVSQGNMPKVIDMRAKRHHLSEEEVDEKVGQIEN